MKKEFKSILVIQLGDIGDVVLSFPVFRAIRENNPNAKQVVAVRTKAKSLFEYVPWVDEVVEINQDKRSFFEEISYQYNFFSCLRKYRFDLAIDLRTGTRGAILAFLSGARERVTRLDPEDHWRNRLFTHPYRLDLDSHEHVAEFYFKIPQAHGLVSKFEAPQLDVTPTMRSSAESILKKHGINPDLPLIAIQPFSLWEYKEWGIDKFSSLIKRILGSYRASVLISGSRNEYEKAQSIVNQCKEFVGQVFNMAGKTSLSEFTAVLSSCSLFIGMDSAGMHIAGAVGTPTAIIFGPSNPVFWAPRGKEHVTINKDMPCLPCNQKGCDGSESSRCLEELEVEEVWAVINARLEEKGFPRNES